MNDTALPPVTLVILGASGDLTHRLLLPGLGTLLTEKPYDVTLIGAAMAPLTDGEWKALVEAALKDAKLRPSRIEAVLAKTRYINVDVTNKDNWLALLPNLPENSVLYFALPPAVTAKACQVLATLDLPKGLKLALEKPFGTSLESAKELNHLLMSVVPENQIFRVDHFLGKATVLNLLGIRFTNRIFEPIWDCGDIESVSIIVDETLGLEGRAGYYDNNGALKDMIQSHLLLMMAIFAMEEPASLDEREVRDLIAHTLRATTLWTDDPVTSSRRARYTSGQIHGTQVPGYVEEPGVDPAKNTETLAEISLRINNSRWHDVKFTLHSGKALGDERNGITVLFRPVPHIPTGFVDGDIARNVLWIGMKPVTLALQVSTNVASDRFKLESTVLSADLDDAPLRPYGEILDEIFEGDPLLSVRGDIAEECWRIVEPVLDAWEKNLVPMDEYTAGWAGPNAWR